MQLGSIQRLASGFMVGTDNEPHTGRGTIITLQVNIPALRSKPQSMSTTTVSQPCVAVCGLSLAWHGISYPSCSGRGTQNGLA